MPTRSSLESDAVSRGTKLQRRIRTNRPRFGKKKEQLQRGSRRRRMRRSRREAGRSFSKQSRAQNVTVTDQLHSPRSRTNREGKLSEAAGRDRGLEKRPVARCGPRVRPREATAMRWSVLEPQTRGLENEGRRTRVQGRMRGRRMSCGGSFLVFKGFPRSVVPPGTREVLPRVQAAFASEVFTQTVQYEKE